MPPPATAEAPSPLLHGPNQGRGWHPYGLLMLLPLPPSATIAQGHRPSTIAAHCRWPPWLGHLRPPRARQRPGIHPAGPPSSFPLYPGPLPRRRAPESGRRRRRSAPPLFSRGERRKKGPFSPKPPPFPLIQKRNPPLLAIFCKRNPVLYLILKSDPHLMKTFINKPLTLLRMTHEVSKI